MHPILFILAIIVGAAHMFLVGVIARYDGIREGAPLWVPLAVIGVAVLTAAGLGIGGVLT